MVSFPTAIDKVERALFNRTAPGSVLSVRSLNHMRPLGIDLQRNLKCLSWCVTKHDRRARDGSARRNFKLVGRRGALFPRDLPAPCRVLYSRLSCLPEKFIRARGPTRCMQGMIINSRPAAALRCWRLIDGCFFSLLSLSLCLNYSFKKFSHTNTTEPFTFSNSACSEFFICEFFYSSRF